MAGNDCFKKGEFQNAVIYYSRAIAAEPNEARLFANRSACFYALNEFARAFSDALVRWAGSLFRAVDVHVPSAISRKR